MTTALGLALVALTQVGEVRDAHWADLSYWTGIVAILFPAAGRIACPSASRREQLSLVMLLGLALYAVKILHSPTRFAHFDEFLHWKTASDLMEQQRLFAPNSLLPISPLYPGLEIVTTAIANLSGLSIFAAGLVLIGIARAIFLSALFLFLETITVSSRIAAIGCIVFMSNPNFSMFHAQFAYETLAFTLLVLIILAEADSEREERHSRAYPFFIALLLAALAVTHHLTSYFAAAFLALLALLKFACPGTGRDRLGTGMVAVVAVLVAYVWPHLVGESTVAYVGPVVERGFKELSDIVGFSASARVPFIGEDGLQQPLWARFTAVAGLVLLCLGLATGFFRSLALARMKAAIPENRCNLRSTGAWADGHLLAFTLVTLVFPLSVLLRLTKSGWEIGNRLGSFASLGTALVAAIAIVGLWQSRSSSRIRAVSVALALGIMLWGGVILGWGPTAIVSRYKVSADAMSIEPLGIAAAEWTREWLGEGNRFATDRVNRLLLATYGHQTPVTTIKDGVDTSYVLFAQEVAEEQLDAIREGMVDYLLVDLRLTSARPVLGLYFEGGEDPAIHSAPPTTDALLKYDALKTVGRPYDNGAEVIYDVRSLYAPR
ncbi:MAG: hypothetical protein ACHQAY_13045 [Hyphomicrobiales bacterium]